MLVRIRYQEELDNYLLIIGAFTGDSKQVASISVELTDEDINTLVSILRTTQLKVESAKRKPKSEDN